MHSSRLEKGSVVSFWGWSLGGHSIIRPIADNIPPICLTLDIKASNGEVVLEEEADESAAAALGPLWRHQGLTYMPVDKS